MSKRPSKPAAEKAGADAPDGKRSLRRQWSELSLEKKLSIVVVPVVLTFVSLLGARLLSGGSEAAPERKENLEVVSEPVVLNDSTLERQGVAEVQFLVRNSGTVDAVINAAEFHVTKFDSAEVCAVPQGELGVSGSYDVVLPAADAEGKVVNVNIPHSVAAGKADRFSFNIKVDDAAPVGGVPRLYALDILLHHTDADEPLEAGQVLVALPFPFSGQFTFTDQAFAAHLLPDPECPARNMKRLKSLLALPAARAAELDRFATNPPPVGPETDSPPVNALDRTIAKTQAHLIGTYMRRQPRARWLKDACAFMESAAIGVLEGTDDCPAYLSSLTGPGSPPPLPEMIETHGGWFKFVTEMDGQRMVFIVEKLARQVEPDIGTLAWQPTNVYDEAAGPLDRTREPVVCSPAPC